VTDILDIVHCLTIKIHSISESRLPQSLGCIFITGPPERLFPFTFRLKTEARTSSETLWFLIPGTVDSIQHFSHEYDLIHSSESSIDDLFIFDFVAGTAWSTAVLDCWWNSIVDSGTRLLVEQHGRQRY
jgi:hypothetical protein